MLYAKMAMKDPEVRPVYEQMAAEQKNNKRPFDMAVSDYFAGNDLLRKSSMATLAPDLLSKSCIS
ncbi:MAG TPA: hypothetical protein VJM08_10955 [Anaerolineales bacterium]|nr:hypothetical protein [Anaerolineales bacterium]